MAADPVGTLAEEASRLLAALSGGPDDGVAPDGSADHGDTGAGSCRWCPHCQAAGLVRDASPESRARLAAAGTALLLALREVVDQAGRAPAERARAARADDAGATEDDGPG